MPEVSSDQMIQEDHTWTVMVSKDGKLSAQGMDFDQSQLFEKLQEQLKSNPQLSLLIEADEELSHGIVVDMMDIAQEVGVSSVQIGATQK